MPLISSGGLLVGMSADDPKRFTEVGVKLYAERIFMGSLSDDKTARIETALKAGRLPVVSTKVGDWATAAKGSVNSQVKALADKLDALAKKYNSHITLTFHHEPQGDGDATSFASMQRTLTPVAKRANVKVGPIMNGWIWRPTNATGQKGIGDAELAKWMPKDLISLWDFVGGDFYENDNNKNSVTMGQARAWCVKNGVKSMVAGEVGTREGSTELPAIAKECLTNTIWDVVCWFNSARNTRPGDSWVLMVGSQRMKDFVAFVAAAAKLAGGTTPEPPEEEDPEVIKELQAKVDALTKELADTKTKVTALEDKVSKAKAALA